MLNSKIIERKRKSPFIIYTDFESILVPEIMKNKIQINLIQTNIKNILLPFIAINYYVLMINLVNVLNLT